MSTLVVTTHESCVRILIISNVPVVTWGIQSALVGLPGVIVAFNSLGEEAPEEAEGETRPDLVVAVPPRVDAELCARLASWRNGMSSPKVVCLSPTACLGPCPHVDITAPLECMSPADLRLLLRRALDQVRTPTAVGERGEAADHAPVLNTMSPPPRVRLSPREREIGLLVTEGHSSSEIAQRLFISQRTVEKHRANLMVKLDVSNAASLTREFLYLCWTEGTDLPDTHCRR